MCGIAGFFESSRTIHDAPVGQNLITMLQGLACRGPDSTGVALFGPGADRQVVLRIKLGEDGDCSARLAALRNFLDSDFASRYQLTSLGNAGRLVVSEVANVPALAAAIEALDKEIEVVSMGARLEIVSISRT